MKLEKKKRNYNFYEEEKKTDRCEGYREKIMAERERDRERERDENEEEYGGR